MLQPEQGETQASFTGIGSRRIPSPLRRLACFFRNLYFSVFLCAANMPPLRRAVHMGGGISLRCHFLPVMAGDGQLFLGFLMDLTRPFLKWAGGKYRLLDRLLPSIPAGARLVEPFVGSGAVFLNAGFACYLLCDLNADLIGLYRTLRRDGERFIAEARALFTPGNNTQEAFLRLRETFNASSDAEERSVLFLYLNRHSYNGLVRYNSKGIYNVPFGKYKAPYFPERELTAFLDKLRGCDVTFAVQDFRSTFAALRPGDVVYCDPPYAPVSATANFTSYTGGGFGVQEQIDLASEASAAAKRGVPVVLSNHDVPLIRELYADARLESFPVQRFISCNGARRGAARELLAVFP